MDHQAVLVLALRPLLTHVIVWLPGDVIPECVPTHGEAGAAPACWGGGDGAVTAPLHQAPDGPAVLHLALAGGGAALPPGDGGEGPVRTELRDTGLGVTVSHRAEGGVRTAVTCRG